MSKTLSGARMSSLKDKILSKPAQSVVKDVIKEVKKRITKK